MSTLAVVEHLSGTATPDSLALLALARGFDRDVRAAVLGSAVDAVALEASRHGASTVYLIDDPALSDALPGPASRVLERLIGAEGFDTVVLATSVLGSDIAGSLAVSLGAGLNWGLVGLELADGQLIGERLAFGDSLSVRVGWLGTPRLALVRPGVAEKAVVEPAGTIVRVVPCQEDLRAEVTVDCVEPVADSGVSLESAEIVVAGGKGLGAAENFALVEDLAAELGGVVAATRAVVELGWYPQSAQVGQTGTTVAPRLYIACGISGAIHHKVGMHRSEAIVAINTDRSAPIFDFCDLGVVGDATRIVPELTAAIRERRRARSPI